jgi:alpha-tubulin suppressor-like RCC1 family protein
LFRDGAGAALRPRSIVAVPSARALALASGFQCIVPPDRDVVRCWGQCGSACGRSENPAALEPAEMFFDTAVVGARKIAASNYTYLLQSAAAACFLAGPGLLSCQGTAAMIGAESNQSTPRPIAALGEAIFVDIALGSGHACAATGPGRVVCWGGTSGNRLGVATDSLATEASRGVFVLKESGDELTGAVRVAAAGGVTCAITGGGRLWCWGTNSVIGLGVGDRNEHVGAVDLGLREVVDVSVGSNHGCAIADRERVYCWGLGALIGQTAGASGDAADGLLFTRPQPVPDLDDAQQLRIGEGHTCALRRSGQVVCWGENDKGQLGDGTTLARFSPTPVVGLYQ